MEMEKLKVQEVKNAKSSSKPYKMADGGGLYLLVKQTGKYWRYDYRYLKKRKTLALGVYPETSLKEARKKHRDAREILRKDVDPIHHKKVVKENMLQSANNSFGSLSAEWLAKQTWTHGHRRTVESRLKRDILPRLKNRPVADITTGDVLDICQRIENRGAVETAHRVRTIIGQVLRHAIARKLIKTDPTVAMKGLLTSRNPKNMAALTKPMEVGALMRAIDGYCGSEITRLALKIAAYTFVRPGELRKAEWTEIDLDRAIWIIPEERMKARNKHLVPLSTQAINVITDLRQRTGTGKYLFPCNRTNARPMSENTILAALRRMGYTKDEMTGHGFRSMASTNLYELGWESRVVEIQLAHKDSNRIRAAYNHAEYLSERTKMMQAWADYLDGLKAGGEIINFKRKA